MTTKTCNRCGADDLPLSAFPIRAQNADGSPQYRSTCRACYNKTRRGTYERKITSKRKPRTDINRGSPCAACHWLGACREIVWTLASLPCEVDSEIEMVVPGARKWRMEVANDHR